MEYLINKRERGEDLSLPAKRNLIEVYNHIIDAILALYETKRQGGILNRTALDEPMKMLYKAKARIWGISQGRIRKRKKKYTQIELFDSKD